MVKRLVFLALFLCVALLVPGNVGLTQTGGLQVLQISVQVNFPGSVNFNITAESNVNVTDIRLHYQVDRMTVARITSEVYLDFAPATMVKTEWQWDMRKSGGLPPGSQVRYWWTVTDARGVKIRTTPEVLSIEDNRYQWRDLTEGKITLYWYRGDDNFASTLMGVTQQALVRIEGDTGAKPERQIRIYIYANSDDLRGSMIFPQEWTGGVTFTQHSTIAIGIAPDSLDWGSRAIAHELTHLVIHQIIFSAYGDLPTWLDEGLAMNAEGPLENVFAALLSQAIKGNSLLSVRSIASPFSAFTEQSALAYAESYSVVKLLIDEYGKDRMFALLQTFQEGSSYDAALRKVYGFDMDELDRLWRSSLPPAGTTAFRMGQESPELAFAV